VKKTFTAEFAESTEKKMGIITAEITENTEKKMGIITAEITESTEKKRIFLFREKIREYRFK
jgi:hypothetical protein